MNINRETFEAWLFSQPDERTFDFVDSRDCLLCKFIKETTNLTPHVGHPDYLLFKGTIESGEQVFFGTMPEWCTTFLSNRPYKYNSDITFGEMKAVFIKLFGDPRIAAVENQVPIPDANVELDSRGVQSAKI